MVPVQEVVDIEAHLDELEPNRWADYEYFLDSNHVRFWFDTPAVAETVRASISSLSWGSVFDTEERRRLNADVSRRYGDLIFVLSPGYLALPNFFQRDYAVAGMHGYHPDTPANHTRLLVDDRGQGFSFRNPDLLDLVDVFPTLTDVIGLPTPNTNQGTSIIEEP